MPNPDVRNLDDPETLRDIRGLYSDDDAFENRCETIGNVIGWHCTRLVSEEEMSLGMIPLNVADRIYVVRTTLIGAGISKRGLLEYDDVSQGALKRSRVVGRAGRIWFCMNKALTRDPGCADFFAHYGGECIYRLYPRADRSEAKQLLQTIGRPVIVKCQVPFKSCSLLGRCNILKSINGRTSEKCEAYCLEALPPEAILGFEWMDIINS